MSRRHALKQVPHFALALTLLVGCSLDRRGTQIAASDAGPPPDASADTGRDAARDGAAACASGTVDEDRDASNGCECMLTSPADEICDGVDNDCNAATADGADDPRLLDPCDDSDADLCVDDVTLCSAGVIVCRPGPTEAIEVCNGMDDDCDGVPDNDAVDAIGFTVDADGDDHGDPVGVVTMACQAPPGQASPSDDCDDTNAAVYPGAPELCDAIDNDCDGMRDEDGCPCDVLERAGHVYLFCTGATSWTGARDACARVGYQLVTIDDPEENSFVRDEATSRSGGNVWIGYNDRSSEGDFVWQGPSSSYTNWSGGEPNNDNCPADILCSEDCVEIYADGSWNDQSCGDSRFYVCEAP